MSVDTIAMKDCKDGKDVWDTERDEDDDDDNVRQDETTRQRPTDGKRTRRES